MRKFNPTSSEKKYSYTIKSRHEISGTPNLHLPFIWLPSPIAAGDWNCRFSSGKPAKKHPDNPVNPVKKMPFKIESIPLSRCIAFMNQFVRYPTGRPMTAAKIHQRWNLMYTSIKCVRTTITKMATGWVVERRRHLTGDCFKTPAVGS